MLLLVGFEALIVGELVARLLPIPVIVTAVGFLVYPDLSLIVSKVNIGSALAGFMRRLMPKVNYCDNS
jgi:hypothetical protein